MERVSSSDKLLGLAWAGDSSPVFCLCGPDCRAFLLFYASTEGIAVDVNDVVCMR